MIFYAFMETFVTNIKLIVVSLDEQKGMSSTKATETRKAVAELSIDYQIYKFIEAAGAAGVFKTDIARIINALSRRSLTNKMHTMTRYGSVKFSRFFFLVRSTVLTAF